MTGAKITPTETTSSENETNGKYGTWTTDTKEERRLKRKRTKKRRNLVEGSTLSRGEEPSNE